MPVNTEPIVPTPLFERIQQNATSLVEVFTRLSTIEREFREISYELNGSDCASSRPTAAILNERIKVVRQELAFAVRGAELLRRQLFLLTYGVPATDPATNPEIRTPPADVSRGTSDHGSTDHGSTA